MPQISGQPDVNSIPSLKLMKWFKLMFLNDIRMLHLFCKPLWKTSNFVLRHLSSVITPLLTVLQMNII